MAEGKSKTNVFKIVFSKKMLITFIFGFSSGLPLLLTGGTLKTWMTREGLSLSTIGYISWVGLAYSLKFIWAPLLDRFEINFLGRRRTWILFSQVLLVVLLFYISSFDPKISISDMALIAIAIAFMSATQDMSIDAYRRESLNDEELGLGSSMYQYGYRVAMLVSGGIGVGLVGSETFNMTWAQMYQLMAIIMGVLCLFTLWAPEPQVAANMRPKTFRESVVEPFEEFFKRPGAVIILLFVFLFKLGDALGGSMLNPFYVQMGYSNQDIALIAKTFGLASSLTGLFLGGLILYYIGTWTALWIFGIMQGLSTALFSMITITGAKAWALTVAVVFEDVSQGMGSAAFVAYLASITHKKYTGTQFALLSSLAMLGRTFFSGFMGNVVASVGWMNFFLFCGAMAIPGLLMLFFMRKFQVLGAKT